MRPFLTRLAAAVALLSPLLAPPARAYESMQGPTETLLWDRARAFEGYTLFAAHGRTFLIDLAGNVVHTWNLGTNPKLLDDGHILDASRDDPSGFGGLVEVDWDGNTVWEYTERRAGYAPHHDFLRVFNPKLGAYTTMYIANRTITQAEALAAGADPAHGPYDGAQVDALVEVDAQGSVIWEWWFLDHVIQDDDPAAPNYAGAGRTIADWPGRLDVNLPGRPLRRDWLHSNSMDYNQELDQVVVNVVQGEFYVIDHGGTFLPGDPEGSVALAAGPAGDFLYRFGDPARYDRGDPPSIPENWTTATAGHKQIGGAHDIHWIRPGLPGAGHFLVFNNGQYLFELTNQSYVDEIAPYLDARGVDTGAYVDPPAAGYTVFEPDRDTHKPRRNLSKQLTWIFGTKSPQGMFSHIGGSAQRLPNGNTLICADTEGHLLEVTSGEAPELVWEYISPMTREGALRVMPDNLPMTNSLFRAYRFAPDHPAFAGRSLVPTGTITGRVPFDPDATPEITPDAGPPTADAAPPVTPDAAPAPTPDAASHPADAARPVADAGHAVADAGVSVADPDAGAVTACTCPPSEKSSDGCQTSAGRGHGAGLFGLLVLGGLVKRRRRSSTRGLRALLCLPLGAMGCGASSEDAVAGVDATAPTPDASTPAPDAQPPAPDAQPPAPDARSPIGDALIALPDVPAATPDAATPGVVLPDLVAIPGGRFEMGDHSGLGGEDPRHPSDEQPLHMVDVSAFDMMRTEVTAAAYVVFLEAALAAGRVRVVDGDVHLLEGDALLVRTRAVDPTSRLDWDGEHFSVLDGRDAHPVTGVRFPGAVAYAGWLSEAAGMTPCMDPVTGAFDPAAACFRLPTEAEWEYAAVAGRTEAYPIYPWGDAVEPARANWPDSGDPFEAGDEPFTTPVGFYDGSLRSRADDAWPAAVDTYQTADGRNPWGLADLAGNAWEWVSDWYGREYYASSPAADPQGPTQAEASPMPDGLPYHVLRGGSWFNGAPDGHSRVSNRDPGYFRGPGDPNGPWHHIGFRLVRTTGRGGAR